MSGKLKNEGEGSQSGAKAYNDATRKFAVSGRVGEAAQNAKRAVEGGEKSELKQAEAEGKRHSKGEDPALRKQSDAVDFKAALINPADNFAEPGAVVVDPSLSRVQKLKILQQWELDARQLAVAEEENMIGGEENMIGRVSKALLALGGRQDPVAEGMTKLG